MASRLARVPARVAAARSAGNGRWRAFTVEAVGLLAVTAFCLAVVVGLVGAAAARSADARELTQAVALVQNAAESFAADPSSQRAPELSGDLVVTTSVETQPCEGGALYRARVEAWRAQEAHSPGAEPVFALETARFVGRGRP